MGRRGAGADTAAPDRSSWPGGAGWVEGTTEEQRQVVIATTRTRAIDEAAAARQRRVISNHGIDRRSFSRIPTVWEMPNLVQVQIKSFDWFRGRACASCSTRSRR